MGFQDDIVKLRIRVADAVGKGVIDRDNKDFLEATLIQIMNEAERNRQNCIINAENLRKQAATFEGQAGAFASVSSIVFSVINGYVLVAERDEAERLAAEAEKAENPVEEATETASEPEKKGRKKKA